MPPIGNNLDTSDKKIIVYSFYFSGKAASVLSPSKLRLGYIARCCVFLVRPLVFQSALVHCLVLICNVPIYRVSISRVLALPRTDTAMYIPHRRSAILHVLYSVV